MTVNAFNRTQTLDNLYVSVFSPSATFHWPGNIKKYKFQNGKVVDSLGNPAVSPATGFFTDTSQSYWSATVDGADVTARRRGQQAAGRRGAHGLYLHGHDLSRRR